ncbi:MAG: DUF2520 domain-containing protein [Planctomycetes bacterium]|nr:DUF2520 domain-containing protein [Planctomycetota bacterium]
MSKRVLVIGPGRVGKCLALAHEQGGATVQLLGRRSGEWQQWTMNNQIAALLEWPLEGPPFDLILLAVADQELQAVVQQCVEHDLVKQAVVAHLSGAFGAEILAPLQATAAATAALHPLMAFSESARSDVQQLGDSAVMMDCADQHHKQVSASVACWHARLKRLPANQDRASYHLGLSLLANHITAITAWAQELLQPALGDETTTLIHAMSQRAISATLEKGGIEALTGPVVRGDVGTVEAHLNALSAQQAERYRGSLLAVIDLAAASGRLDSDKEAQLRALAKGLPAS